MADTHILSHSAQDQFRSAMRAKGIIPPEVIIADGQRHRFASNGRLDDDAGWYVFYDEAVASGAFGDFRTGQTVGSWVADVGHALTPDEKAYFQSQQKEARLKREAETIERRAKAKTKAQNMLKHSSSAHDSHPYLFRKNVRSYGLRLWNDLVLVPMIDATGQVQSAQIISANGDKKFLSGGKMQGCYFTLGNLAEAEMILIAEGYATAATIHELTGHPVVVAFNAGNLLAVTGSIKEQYPEAAIYLCADDDFKTEGNPGIIKASEAAMAVKGSVIIPDFGANRPDKATDFNDMAEHLGKEKVRSFFIKHFMNEGQNALRYEEGTDVESLEAPLICQPSKQVLADVSPESKEVITGRITDFGSAPYKFDRKNNKSFYVNIQTGDTIRTLWGIDLEPALAQSGLGVNAEVAIHNKGKVPVQVMSKIRDEQGTVIREEPRTVMKGAWKVEALEDYVEKQIETAPPVNLERHAPSQADRHSCVPRLNSNEPELEPKRHFTAQELEVINRIWKMVPRRLTRHNEASYDLVIDEKQKVTISRDRIELARKSRHRPDAAYKAACDHAKAFWNCQMEVHGDTEHRVKAWAFATVYGLEVTNFTPADRELAAAEKIMARLRKDMEPGFSRPTARPGVSKQSTKLQS